MATPAKSARVTFNPQHQNVEAVNKIVASILGRAGCLTCGRISFLDLHFLGDPEPDIAKLGVISVETQGF